jgi:DNA-binding MarR family transcriptional regulator
MPEKLEVQGPVGCSAPGAASEEDQSTMFDMSSSPPLPFDPISEAMRHWRSHGWSHAARGMGLVTSIVRVEQLLSARAEGLVKEFGLTFARYEVLMLLAFSQRGELPLGKIGQRLQVHPASVTNAIDRLEDDQLVRRRVNPDDGRSVLAAITDKGARLSQSATVRLNDELFSQLDLSQADSNALFALLAKLRRRAGDFE